MAFLKSIFNKKEKIITEEEILKVEEIISKNKKNVSEISENKFENQNKNSKIEESIDFEKIISKVKINQINKIRNLLDKRERELTGDDSLYKPKNNEQYIGANSKQNVDSLEIGNKYKKKDLDNQTYQEKIGKKTIKNIKTKPKKVEKKINPFEKLIEEIKTIFGENNIILNEDKINNNIQIGIRNLEAFKQETHWAEQNKWFVNKIKNFSELKKFKVLNSKEGLKDLIYKIDENNSIILSFRSTNLLKDKKSFEFIK